jgi:outer membrane protein assembly factor BamB
MRRPVVALALAILFSAPAAADTPRVLWEGRPVRAPAAPPALSGDTLWVSGSERRLVSMNARTGKRQWRRNLPGNVCVGPLPVRDRLIVGLDDVEPSLLALDRQRGRALWNRRLSAAPIAIFVRDDLAIVAGSDGHVEAFRLADGLSRWTRETGRRLAGAALADSSLCLIARRDSLWLFDPASGRPRAARAIPGLRSAAPVAAGARFLCPRYDGTVLSINAVTGMVADSAAGPAPQIASGSVHEDRWVTVAAGGEVTCYRLPGLAQEWNRTTGETVSTGALAWNDTWIVLTEKGRVLGLAKDRGQTAWSLQFPNPISTPAACSERLLAIVDNRGRVVVHAIDGAP